MFPQGSKKEKLRASFHFDDEGFYVNYNEKDDWRKKWKNGLEIYNVHFEYFQVFLGNCQNVKRERCKSKGFLMSKYYGNNILFSSNLFLAVECINCPR